MGPPSPITSRTNPRVKALRAALRGGASAPGDTVGLEGAHLVREALASGIRLLEIFVREGSEAVLAEPGFEGATLPPVCFLSREVFDSAVSVRAPQGLAATMRIAAPRAPQPDDHAALYLFLEEVQDPGNVGTLIRSAEAFGAHSIHVTAGTANAWNAKVMRASAGSVFRMRIVPGSVQEFGAAMQACGASMLAAVSGGADAVLLKDAKLLGPCAVMIGNEGAGLSEAALALATQRVRIPCAVESLNAGVAGSVFLFEAARRRSEHTQRGGQ